MDLLDVFAREQFPDPLWVANASHRWWVKCVVGECIIWFFDIISLNDVSGCICRQFGNPGPMAIYYSTQLTGIQATMYTA